MPFVRKNPFFAHERGSRAQHQLLQEVDAFPGQDTGLSPYKNEDTRLLGATRSCSIVDEGLTIRELLQ